MILNALGESFTSEFKVCGHAPVHSEREATTILRQLESGTSRDIRAGLHALAGHAGPAIGSTLAAQREALVNVAGGVATGTLSPEDHGRLLAGSQFQTASIGRQIQQRVHPDSILKIYHASVDSPRIKTSPEFQSWMVGTSIAALRESSSPSTAAGLLREVLKDPSLAHEIRLRRPSHLREILILAAPSLCMPELFECYELSLVYGTAEERGLALVNVRKLPEVITALGPTHPARGTLLEWSSRYRDALALAIESQDSLFVDPSTSARSTKRFFERSELAETLRSLSRTTGSTSRTQSSGDLTSRSRPSVMKEHICGPHCRHEKPLIPHDD
jgi:hypothetical protein